MTETRVTAATVPARSAPVSIGGECSAGVPGELVTVVIPAHNRARLLREAITSVIASPIITRPECVVVVDDDSADETPQVAAGFGVRYLRGQFGGPSATRNAGLTEVRTPYVAFLDDDDGWLPGAMGPQLAALAGEPRAAFAYGRAQRTSMDLRLIGPPFPEPPLPARDSFALVYRTHMQLGAILFRTESVREEGGFDANLRYCEDWHLLVRLAARRPAIGVDFVSSLFRQREESLADARARPAVYRDYARAKRDLVSRGIRPAMDERVSAHRAFVGLESFLCCHDARLFVAAGERREAAAALLRGLRLSPMHALLGHREFWPSAAALLKLR